MRSFTLIETLATVVLIAMIASVGAIGLVGASDSARWRETIAIVQATDTDARSLALTSGPVTLTLNRDRDTLHLYAGGDLVLERPVPVLVHLVDPQRESPIDELVFDPTGRTRDYLVVVEHGEQRQTFRIAGLTGWVSE